MIETLSAWLVDFVHGFGYLGIFIMTFLESTFVPIPSEVTMIPAGYLVHKGEMNFGLVWGSSILGTVGGALLNYWLAKRFGRWFLMRYGKYMLFGPEKLAKLEKYFAAHGQISTFTGRLIPGLRHFISFPAGLAHMDLKKFCIYTGLGGAIWMAVLIGFGYLIGDNKDLVKQFLPGITYLVLGFVVLMVLLYIRRHKRKLMPLG